MLVKTREAAVDSFCKVEHVYEPNPAAVAKYAELYEIHKSLVPHYYDAWDARSRFLAAAEVPVAKPEAKAVADPELFLTH